jgi:hypothetical protein
VYAHPLLFFSFHTNIAYRKAKEADPANWHLNIKYEYSLKTSTLSLCPHIKKYHLLLFQQLAKDRGWKILLPGLVSQARSQASMVSSAQGERHDTFDEDTFHQKLLSFIVMDDQVLLLDLHLVILIFTTGFKSINVIECHEFRVLMLLLRNDLKDSMIPHHTKMRELIVNAWKRYFQTLKADLVVPLSIMIKLLHTNPLIQKAASEISVTADIWSDQNRQSYLAMTAHWIAKVDETTALNPKVALVAFHHVLSTHNGKLLAKIVLQLLNRAEITLKVKTPL